MDTVAQIKNKSNDSLSCHELCSSCAGVGVDTEEYNRKQPLVNKAVRVAYSCNQSRRIRTRFRSKAVAWCLAKSSTTRVPPPWAIEDTSAAARLAVAVVSPKNGAAIDNAVIPRDAAKSSSAA